jgi:hypothetical protein
MSRLNQLIEGHNLNGLLVALYPRHEEGYLVALFQNDDHHATMTEIVHGDYGWKHLVTRHAWYPMLFGSDVTNLLAKLEQFVAGIPEELLSDWVVACMQFEQQLVEGNRSEGCYDDFTVEFDMGDWRPFDTVTKTMVEEYLNDHHLDKINRPVQDLAAALMWKIEPHTTWKEATEIIDTAMWHKSVQDSLPKREEPTEPATLESITVVDDAELGAFARNIPLPKEFAPGATAMQIVGNQAWADFREKVWMHLNHLGVKLNADDTDKLTSYVINRVVKEDGQASLAVTAWLALYEQSFTGAEAEFNEQAAKIFAAGGSLELLRGRIADYLKAIREEVEEEELNAMVAFVEDGWLECKFNPSYFVKQYLEKVRVATKLSASLMNVRMAKAHDVPKEGGDGDYNIPLRNPYGSLYKVTPDSEVEPERLRARIEAQLKKEGFVLKDGLWEHLANYVLTEQEHGTLYTAEELTSQWIKDQQSKDPED